MKRHLTWIIPVCVIVAVVLLFLMLFRKETVEEEIMDLQKDRFKAAKMFLTSRGFEVQEIDFLDEIEAQDNGVVVFALGENENLNMIWMLDETVDGYHLIFLHHGEIEPGLDMVGPAKEFFLDELPENLEDSFRSVVSIVDKGLASFPPYPDVQLKLTGSTFFKMGNDCGFAIHIDHGASRLTALSDDSFMSNGGLGAADNAAYLLLLSTSFSVRPKIYFLSESTAGTQSLWSLIWQKGKPVVLSAMVCLLIFLWVNVPRFGPVLPDPPIGRRSIQDHIFATAKFHWRRGHRALLVDVVRFDVIERIRRVRPDWVGLEPSLLHKQLAESTALKEDQVALALSSTPPAEAFLSVLAYLQTIRRSL